MIVYKISKIEIRDIKGTNETLKCFPNRSRRKRKESPLERNFYALI